MFLQWMSFFPRRHCAYPVLEYLHEAKALIYYGDLKPDNLYAFRFRQIVSGGFWERMMFGFRENQRIYVNRRFAAPEQYEEK